MTNYPPTTDTICKRCGRTLVWDYKTGGFFCQPCYDASDVDSETGELVYLDGRTKWKYPYTIHHDDLPDGEKSFTSAKKLVDYFFNKIAPGAPTTIKNNEEHSEVLLVILRDE